MYIKTWSTLLIFSLLLPNKALGSDEQDWEKLLERAGRFSTYSRVRVKGLLDESHPLRTSKHPKAKQALLLLEEAHKQDQKFAIKLLTVRRAEKLLREAVYALSSLEDALTEVEQALVEEEITQIIYEADQEEEEYSLADAIKTFEEGLPTLAEYLDDKDLEGLKTAFKEAKSGKALVVGRDNEAILIKVSNIKQVVTSLIRPINDRLTEVNIEVFELSLEAPEVCPTAALNWRIQAINCGHRLNLTGMEQTTQTRFFEQMLGLHQVTLKDLQNATLEENLQGDIMVALLRPWTFDTFKAKVRENWSHLHFNEKYYLPKPLPQAALLFSWAQLLKLKAVALRHHDNQADVTEMVEGFKTKVLEGVDILEKQDVPPQDFFSLIGRKFQTITQGMSRYLAIEMLQECFRQLRRFHLSGIIEKETVQPWNKALTEKAQYLADNMEFSSQMGDERNFYQALSYLRLSSIYENPILQYICREFASKIYSSAEYKDVHSELACYFNSGNAFVRVFYLKSEQNTFAANAEKAKHKAHQAAIAQAQAFLKDATEDKSIQERLVLLAKADAMASVANNIIPESSVELLESINTPITALLDEIINQYQEKRGKQAEALEDANIFIFKGLEQLQIEFKDSIEAIQEARQVLWGPHNLYKLEWSRTENPKQKKAIDLIKTHKKEFRETVGRALDVRIDSYRMRAEKGEDATTLAAEYRQELMAWKKALDDFVPLWDKTALIAELLLKSKIQSIEEAKSLKQLRRAHRAAVDYLLGLRDQYPEVYHSYETATKRELYAENSRRKCHGQKELTLAEFEPDQQQRMFIRIYGWDYDAQGAIPEGWLEGLKSQRVLVDGAVLNYMQKFSCVFSKPGFQDSRLVLAEHEVMVAMIKRAQDRLDPYNLLSLVAQKNQGYGYMSWGYAHRDETNFYDKMRDLQRKYSEDKVKKLHTLVAIWQKIEEPITLADVPTLIKQIKDLTPNTYYYRNSTKELFTAEYFGDLKELIVQRSLNTLYDLSEDQILAKVRSISVQLENLRSMNSVEKQVEKLLLEKLQVRKAPILEAFENFQGDEDLETLVAMVESYESYCKEHFQNEWGGFNIKLGDYTYLRLSQYDVMLPETVREKIRKLKNESRERQIAAEEKAREVKREEEAQERINAAEAMRRRQVQRRLITQGYDQALYEVRNAANRVKEETNEDSEKAKHYETHLETAQNLLREIEQGPYCRDLEVIETLKTLKEVIEKLQACLLKYSK